MRSIFCHLIWHWGPTAYGNVSSWLLLPIVIRVAYTLRIAYLFHIVTFWNQVKLTANGCFTLDFCIGTCLFLGVALSALVVCGSYFYESDIRQVVNFVNQISNHLASKFQAWVIDCKILKKVVKMLKVYVLSCEQYITESQIYFKSTTGIPVSSCSLPYLHQQQWP